MGAIGGHSNMLGGYRNGVGVHTNLLGGHMDGVGVHTNRLGSHMAGARSHSNMFGYHSNALGTIHACWYAVVGHGSILRVIWMGL